MQIKNDKQKFRKRDGHVDCQINRQTYIHEDTETERKKTDRQTDRQITSDLHEFLNRGRFTSRSNSQKIVVSQHTDIQTQKHIDTETETERKRQIDKLPLRGMNS